MDIYDIPVTDIDGSPHTLAEYRGKVLLIVNVASACACTPQYGGLEELYREYRDRGFVVLGFPCNQFGWQEPGTDADVKQFCSLKYRVTFQMFSKIKVNGRDSHPLYQHLKSAARGLLWTRSIKWNFSKFLVDRNGKVVGRFSSLTTPSRLKRRIEALLEQPTA